jgi:hypothetical protein
MATKTYSGSCHCGAVKYEADMDPSKGTTRCNCSICAKTRAWFAIVPAEHVRVLSGADALADYQWKPPGQAESHLHYRFCKTCGVRTFAYGEPPKGGPFYAIAVASLDGADPAELTAAIKYVDGRSGHYDRAPEHTNF